MLSYNYMIPFLSFLANFVQSDENIHVLNHNRPLNIVSDKFLSFSIDPAILLTSINLSNVSLQIASHMSPAYVRIAGPSTEFVKYIDTDDKSVEIGSSDVDSVTVTPSVWFAINEWFAMANLTPVFGINDAETVMGVWNPKSILPLLELSDKLNVSCLWQLGYDCSNKTSSQYIEDLRILRHILDAFQDKRDVWKIVGSNIRECANIYDTRRIINELKGMTDIVMWENSEDESDLNRIKDDFVRSLFTLGRNYPKVWTTGSKSHHTATFETALQWAKEVGEASRQGFNVILRQPRIHEFFVDTPVFWFSLIYKTLVGNIVLDLKSTGTQSNAEAFAYCSKNQNNFIQRGAMTLMIVNQEKTESKIHLKMMSLPSSIEVQSYILSTKSDMRSIYLNNERLRVDMLESDKVVFTPKLRRAKPTNGISLTVPEKSIAFFVLPGAKVPTCAEENEEMTLLMEEIKEDQELSFSDEIAIDLKSRLSQRNLSLREMQKNLEDELEADEKFYDTRKKGKASEKIDDVLENLKDKYDNEDLQTKLQFTLDAETKKMILDRAKLAQTQKKITESEQSLLDLGKLFMSKSKSFPKNHIESMRSSEEILPANDIDKFEPKSYLLSLAKSRTNNLRELLASRPKNKFSLSDFYNNHHLDVHGNKKLSSYHPKTLNDQLKEILEKPKSNFHRKHLEGGKSCEKSTEADLELSSTEIKKILMDRVKSRAARTNIRFTNEELVDIMKKATAKLKNDHISMQSSRRLARRDTESLRSKKDINMKLLNEVTKQQNLRKEKKTRNIYDLSEESTEMIPEKSIKSKIFRHSKKIIVNPLSEISNHGKQFHLKDRRDSDLQNETEDDWDYFSDGENSEEAASIHHVHEFKPITKKSDKLKTSEVAKIKSIPELKTRTLDLDEPDDFFKKFTRLDEYFRNAKEFQEKFDDIDFSDESDYVNMDSNEKPMRLKRHDNKKGTNECNCKDCGKSGDKCECCNSKMLQKVMNAIEPLFGNASHENLENFFQQNSKKYEELADSLCKRLDAQNGGKRKVQKSKRSILRKGTLTNYIPMREYRREWRPQDVMSLQTNSKIPSKYHPSKSINDLPFYEHLLHGNDKKRSIQDNEISYDSSENNKINTNKIEKDSSSESLKGSNTKDYKVVFPNKDELELKKDDNGMEFILEHKHDAINNGIEKSNDMYISNTTTVSNDNEVLSENVVINTDLDKMNVVSRKNKNSSNIQQISKQPVDSGFQKILHHLTSFFCRMGNKIKNYFSD